MKWYKKNAWEWSGSEIKNSEKLMNKITKKPNVIGFDYGDKISKGKPTGEKAIRIFVEKKIPQAQLSKKDKVGEKILGEKTDVIEIGEVVAEGFMEAIGLGYSRKGTHRPFKMGVSVGNKRITAGTAGCVVLLYGKKMLFTNAHVGSTDPRLDVSEQPERRCVQAGHVDNPADKEFGELRKMIKMVEGKTSFNDACIIEPDDEDDLDPEILEIGVPTGMAMVKVGDNVRKSGRTTSLTKGQVMSLSATLKINYGTYSINHAACVLCTNMSAGGDSGSIYLVENEVRVWGYGFAGSPTVTVCHPIQNALNAMGASLYVGNNPPPEPGKVRVDFKLKKNIDDYTVYGTVTDEDSVPIKDCIISMYEGEENIEGVETSDSGDYEINDIPPGKYTIEAVAEGYTPATVKVVLGEETTTFRL